MSNVSTSHNVVPFIAGETKPFSGQRLAKIGFKKTDKNPNPLPSIAVSVPFLNGADITENLTKLLPYIGNMLESAQDGIIRARYESRNGDLDTVHDTDISVPACIAYLNAEAEGDRLTKETLQAWFDTAMSETVFVLLAEKLGFTANDPTPAQSVRISQGVTAYRDLVSSLSGGKTVLQLPQITSLRKVLDVIATDDISRKLVARLDGMEKKLQKMAEFSDLL